MQSEERLIAWMLAERTRLDEEIESLSSGKARAHVTRGGRTLDVTGERLKDVQRRRAELQALIGPGEG